MLSGRELVRHVMSLVKRDVRVLAWVAFLVVILLVFLGCLHWELALVTVIPLGLGWLWTLGIMGWMGLSFNLLNVVVSIFVFGLGVDFSLFFLKQTIHDFHLGGEELDLAVSSVLISALTTILGMGVLIFASHPLLYSVGVTALISIGCTLVTTIFLTPWLTRALVKRGQVAGPFHIRTVINSLSGLAWFFGGLLLLLPCIPVLVFLRYQGLDVSRWVRRYMMR